MLGANEDKLKHIQMWYIIEAHIQDIYGLGEKIGQT